MTITGTIDTVAVAGILPHRYPMLLVDRVVALEPGVGLVAQKAITASEPWFRDGARMEFPPVLLLESWCQAAGILVAHVNPNPDVLSGQVMLFGSIADVRFGRPVVPGDVVEHRVRLVKDLGDTAVFDGESSVDGEPMLWVGRITMAMRPAAALTAPATAMGGVR